MKTITFYSYKGGVGRTLLLANLAKRLAEVGKTVCILDFDLEAPSSSSKFGFAKFGTDAKTGLVDYIYDFQENKKLPETIETTELFTTYADKFFLIKAGDSSNSDYWKKLLKISWNKLFYEQDSEGIEFLLYFKDLIKKQINPDYLLIDTRTGITEIASVTISLFADEVVMLSGNNKDSLDGSKQVLKTITNKENIYNDTIPNIYFILSRLPNPETIKEKENEERTLNQHLSNINKHLIDNNYELKEEHLKIIHSDRQLELKEELKIGYGMDNEDTIAKDYYEIFNLIFRDSLSGLELDNFYNIKKSEKIYSQALIEMQSIEENGIEIIKKKLQEAVSYNKNNWLAKYQLSYILTTDNKLDEAKSISEEIIKHTILNGNALIQLAWILTNKREFLKAKDIFLKAFQYFDDKVFAKLNILMCDSYLNPESDYSKQYEILIKENETNVAIYNSYSDYLRTKEKYEEAKNILNKAFEINSEYALGYATLAEIYSMQDQDAEFYRNFELALKFKLTSNIIFNFDVIDIYKKYFEQERFIKLLEKYNYKYTIKRINKYLGKNTNDNDDF